MSINKLYTQEIKKQTTYSAVWFPNTTVQPGDVGRLIDYRYQHIGHLKDFDIDCNITKNSNEMSFSYSSADSVSIKVKLSGHEALPGSSLSISDAGVMIRFSKEKGIVFHLSKCKSTMIDNMKQVEDKIISLSKLHKWDDNMVVVTEAVKARSATILISNSHNAAIDLLATGVINLAKLNLADLNAKFDVASKSNLATEFVCDKKLTPLFRTCGVKISINQKRSPDYNYKYMGAPFSGDFELDVGFGSVDYSDFDDE